MLVKVLSVIFIMKHKYSALMATLYFNGSKWLTNFYKSNLLNSCSAALFSGFDVTSAERSNACTVYTSDY